MKVAVPSNVAAGHFRPGLLKLIRSVYHHRAQYIIAKSIDGHEPRPCSKGGTAGPEIECLVVDSLDLLGKIEREIPDRFRDSASDLRNRVKQGCILFIARRHGRGSGEKEVVGYSIGQRGIFSALGRKCEISSDILFSHYVEVLSEFRGEGVYQMIDALRNDYCRLNGVKKVCSVVSPSNKRSLEAVTKAGFARVGKVERLSILRDVFVWETPRQKIEKLLSCT